MPRRSPNPVREGAAWADRLGVWVPWLVVLLMLVLSLLNVVYPNGGPR